MFMKTYQFVLRDKNKNVSLNIKDDDIVIKISSNNFADAMREFNESIDIEYFFQTYYALVVTITKP